VEEVRRGMSHWGERGAREGGEEGVGEGERGSRGRGRERGEGVFLEHDLALNKHIIRSFCLRSLGV